VIWILIGGAAFVVLLPAVGLGVPWLMGHVHPVTALRAARRRTRDVADRLTLLVATELVGPDPRELAAGTRRLLEAAHGRHRLGHVPQHRAGGDW
jgi:hypothetical protein